MSTLPNAGAARADPTPVPVPGGFDTAERALVNVSNMWLYLLVAAIAPILAAAPVAKLTRRFNPPSESSDSQASGTGGQTPTAPSITQTGTTGAGSGDVIQTAGDGNVVHKGDKNFNSTRVVINRAYGATPASDTGQDDVWGRLFLGLVVGVIVVAGFARWIGIVVAASIGVVIAVLLVTGLLVRGTRQRIAGGLPMPAKVVVAQNLAAVALFIVVWGLVASTTRSEASIYAAHRAAVTDGGVAPFRAIGDAIGSWGFGLIAAFAVGVVFSLMLLVACGAQLRDWAAYLYLLDAADRDDDRRVMRHLHRASRFVDLDWRVPAMVVPIAAAIAILASSGVGLDLYEEWSSETVLTPAAPPTVSGGTYGDGN